MVTVLDRGDLVDDFELPDQRAVPRRLTRLLTEGPVVLFFHPGAADVARADRFREVTSRLAGLGATRLAICVAEVDRRLLAERCGIDFPLLFDAGAAVTARFGARRELPRWPLRARRRTFVIGGDRRVRSVFRGEVDLAGHAEAALRALRDMID